MLLLDVNVVLAAHRADHPHHGSVRPWFDDLVSSGHDFAVPSTVWASFLRLATNRRIFEIPSPLAAVSAFVEATVAQSGHVRIEPGPRHLTLLSTVCSEADAVGDLVPDAVIATIAREHGATVVTSDRDFARFDGLATIRPAPPAP